VSFTFAVIPARCAEDSHIFGRHRDGSLCQTQPPRQSEGPEVSNRRKIDLGKLAEVMARDVRTDVEEHAEEQEQADDLEAK